MSNGQTEQLTSEAFDIIAAINQIIGNTKDADQKMIDKIVNEKKGFMVLTYLMDRDHKSIELHENEKRIANYLPETGSYIKPSEGSIVLKAEDIQVFKFGDKKMGEAIEKILTDGKVVIAGTRDSMLNKNNSITQFGNYGVFEDYKEALLFTLGLCPEREIFIAPYSKNIYDDMVAVVDAKMEKQKNGTHLKGDIIITDPCYVCIHRDFKTSPQWDDYMSYKSIRDYPDYDKESDSSKLFHKEREVMDEAYRKWDKENPDDWDDFAETLERNNIEDYIMGRTLVGDWSCETVDSEGNVLGRFCADSGEVGVFLLDDIKRYNPSYDPLENPHCVTVIKDFDGCVKLTERDGAAVVEGEGNINFFTRQTDY